MRIFSGIRPIHEAPPERRVQVWLRACMRTLGLSVMPGRPCHALMIVARIVAIVHAIKFYPTHSLIILRVPDADGLSATMKAQESISLSSGGKKALSEQ